MIFFWLELVPNLSHESDRIEKTIENDGVHLYPVLIEQSLASGHDYIVSNYCLDFLVDNSNGQNPDLPWFDRGFLDYYFFVALGKITVASTDLNKHTYKIS